MRSTRFVLALVALAAVAVLLVPAVAVAAAQGSFNHKGDILVAGQFNNRVIAVTMAKHVVWSYGKVNGGPLNAPAFASRLKNGDTLIADGGNNRVVQVNKAGREVWSYVTNTRAGSVSSPAPSQAVRLRDGRTLISDQFNEQVIAVDKAKHIVWSYGQIGVAGNGPGQLNAPYGAKAIGDYTGLTPVMK